MKIRTYIKLGIVKMLLKLKNKSIIIFFIIHVIQIYNYPSTSFLNKMNYSFEIIHPKFELSTSSIYNDIVYVTVFQHFNYLCNNCNLDCYDGFNIDNDNLSIYSYNLSSLNWSLIFSLTKQDYFSLCTFHFVQ